MLYYDALHSAAGIETNGTLKNWRKDMRSLDGQKKQAKFQFVAPLRIASAVLYFCIAWLYSFFSDGLVDINLYSLVFRGKEFVKGTIFPAQRISPQPVGTLVT